MTIKELVETKKYRIDTYSLNGLQVFAALTIIRALQDDPKIVDAIYNFSNKYKYSISKMQILRLCGSVYMHNSGHWLTAKINSTISPEFKIRGDEWHSKIPFAETGIIYGLNDAFQNYYDGWMAQKRAGAKDIDKYALENRKYYYKRHNIKVIKKGVKKCTGPIGQGSLLVDF
jgi:hypothetical protein